MSCAVVYYVAFPFSVLLSIHSVVQMQQESASVCVGDEECWGSTRIPGTDHNQRKWGNGIDNLGEFLENTQHTVERTWERPYYVDATEPSSMYVLLV